MTSPTANSPIRLWNDAMRYRMLKRLMEERVFVVARKKMGGLDHYMPIFLDERLDECRETTADFNPLP